MTPIVWTYLSYLLISISLTVWVAKTLHQNGRIFLVDSFLGNEALADSINHLLFVAFTLSTSASSRWPSSRTTSRLTCRVYWKRLAPRSAGSCWSWASCHFFNLLIFSKMRKRALLQNALPPVPPQAYVEVAKP